MLLVLVLRHKVKIRLLSVSCNKNFDGVSITVVTLPIITVTGTLCYLSRRLPLGHLNTLLGHLFGVLCHMWLSSRNTKCSAMDEFSLQWS